MNIHLGLNGEIPLKSIVEDFASVGMIRAEYICRKVNAYITDPSCQVAMRVYLGEIAELFQSKPVWYRLIELETGEINILEGCDHFIQEKTQMLGLRGIRRALMFPSSLETQLNIISEVYQKQKNIGILLPYVTYSHEVEKFLSFLPNHGLTGISVGCMLEIPSIYYEIDFLIKLGIRYFVLGLNDLTSLILGSARNTSTYNQNSTAVWSYISEMTDKLRSENQKLFLAGYLEPTHLSNAVELGIDNVIIHYHLLADTLGKQWENFPHQISLENFKEKMLLRQKFIEKLNKQ